MQQTKRKIKITCEVKETLALDKMTELQGELKQRTAFDYEKIMSSIYKHGIAFPFFVWKEKNTHYILDGHGRTEALRKEQERGVKIPELPVVYVEAANKTTALNLLLRLNSRYGEITIEGVSKFLEDVEIEIGDIHIPELPDLAAQLDALLYDATDGGNNAPEFVLYCPECGERYDVSDDELKEAVGYED
jgi:hypothetical protein